jgi:hypothetical protein
VAAKICAIIGGSGIEPPTNGSGASVAPEWGKEAGRADAGGNALALSVVLVVVELLVAILSQIRFDRVGDEITVRPQALMAEQRT